MSYLALKPAKPAEISWFPAKQIGERISDVDAAFRVADLHDKLDQAEKYCIAVPLSKIVQFHKRHLVFIFLADVKTCKSIQFTLKENELFVPMVTESLFDGQHFLGGRIFSGEKSLCGGSVGHI